MAEKLTSEQIELKRLELMERQIALQEKQAAALETQVERTAPKENANFISAGPFNAPDGKAWAATLKCEIYDGPIHLNDTNLTEEEAKQLNRLEPLEKGLVTRADRKQVEAKVTPTFDVHGTLSKLVITRPMGRDDNAQHFPPLDEMAKQLADQALKAVA